MEMNINLNKMDTTCKLTVFKEYNKKRNENNIECSEASKISIIKIRKYRFGNDPHIKSYDTKLDDGTGGSKSRSTHIGMSYLENCVIKDFYRPM